MKYDALVVGGGPGGLSCAALLAKHGVRVLVLERSRIIGTKVCAGGITYNGLLHRIPASLLERTFEQQTITTRRQTVTVSSPKPMLATVNRLRLGGHMARQALEAGADVLTEARLTGLEEGSATYRHGGTSHRVAYGYLVGADGSSSPVRSWLQVSTRRLGLGINYDVGGRTERMIWNFDVRRFGNGYSWIFPHRDRFSAGAYTTSASISPTSLTTNLLLWLEQSGQKPNGSRLQAGRINSDYRGFRFGRTFLVGDAAGLASPLTGEGIFPAIISGEAVARTIIEPDYRAAELFCVIRKHRKHELLQKISGSSNLIAQMLAEVSAFLLKRNILSFKQFEMA